MALHNLLFLAMSAILNSYTSALIATPQPTVPNYFRGNNWERIKKKTNNHLELRNQSDTDSKNKILKIFQMFIPLLLSVKTRKYEFKGF